MQSEVRFIQEEVPREYLLVAWENFGRGVPWWSVCTSTTSMPVETKHVPPIKRPTRHASRVLMGSAYEWRSKRTSSSHMLRSENEFRDMATFSPPLLEHLILDRTRLYWHSH